MTVTQDYTNKRTKESYNVKRHQLTNECFFSRWRASAILDFQKLEISTSGPIRRPDLRHRAKFREGRSNHSRDMADFRFFKMAAAAILDF